MYHKYLTILTLSMAALASTYADTQHTVAYDDLGSRQKSPHLESGASYTWPDTVPAEVKDRTIAFGETVSLVYGNAVRGEQYTAKLVLSADQEARHVSILVDGEVVVKDVVVAKNSEHPVKLTIPAKALADGMFQLEIHNSKGRSPNATLSSATILSSTATPLTVVTPDFGLENIQYTPIPDSQKTEPSWLLSLNGTWRFSPKAPESFASLTPDKNWANIEVPGQWINQGFDIDPKQPTAYMRTFEVPAAWKNRLVKLRFDAVFSDCEVFVNGKPVGAHTGGFTPFEIDITAAIIPGPNTLSLRVTSWSLADQMASASKYACHPLGGISRDVTLFSVPKTHLKDVIIRTDFDAQFNDAQLDLTLKIAGEKSATTPVRMILRDHNEQVVFDTSKALTPGTHQLSLPVKQPKHWTPESPYLYQLEISVAGSTTRHQVGFREVQVTQSQVLVNGAPVKLRGINHHEAHPLRGRSLPNGLWEQDVLLFRDANINLIRTCHYPPATHLGTACDKHGVWLEIEGPFCWEKLSNNTSHRILTVRQLAEMVKTWRNHPSVLYWSIANESAWGKNFIAASKVMRELDPTRPQTFNWMYKQLITQDESHCELGNIHYPGYNGEPIAKKYSKRPLMFGEYAHLNAYNRREQMTDPGLRDQWGEPLSSMWETMWHEQSIAGGAIWSGIDDTFFMGDDITVGYGAWGPVDPWRRPKPEHWHVKKVYSPVHITNRHEPAIGAKDITLTVENRGDFLNFNQLTFSWKHGNETGTVTPDIAARAKGEITIAPPSGIKRGEPVSLTVTHPLGYVVDEFIFQTTAPVIPKPELGRVTLTKSDTHIEIRQGKSLYRFHRKTGAFTCAHGDTAMIQWGPHLVLTPHNTEGNIQMMGKTKTFDAFHRTASQWQLRSVEASQAGDAVTVQIHGNYKEATGQFTFTFSADSPPRLDYDFTMKVELSPRQTGVVFDLPNRFDSLTWLRQGQWTTYPDDHIGRLRGTAKARYGNSPDVIEIGPRTKPEWPWSQDNTRFGSNDFRATKMNIRHVTLASDNASLEIFSNDSPCHFQALVSGERTKAFVYGYANAGAERFLKRLASRDYRPLKPGDHIKGSFHLSVGK
ncbi:MAG: glycoside hydrolase family 2 [Akkermansiaceae bacterium]|nr:glycoside hydrolase family 2 [Akkermansiaceae bacterium]